MKFTIKCGYEVVAGLEAVSAENALVMRVPWKKPASALQVGEETTGVSHGEQYRLIRVE